MRQSRRARSLLVPQSLRRQAAAILALSESQAMRIVAAACRDAEWFGLAQLGPRDNHNGPWLPGHTAVPSGLLSETWLRRVRLPLRKWVALAWFFDWPFSVRQVAATLGLSRSTANRAMETIRLSLAALDPDWDGIVLATLGGERGRNAWVLGIISEDGRTRVAPVRDACVLQRLVRDAPRRAVAVNGYFCMSGHDGFDAFLCGRSLVGHGPLDSPRPKRKPRLGFLSFLRSRMARFHGVSPRLYPLYIKECELRYQLRRMDLFCCILRALSGRPPLHERDRCGVQLPTRAGARVGG